MTESPARAPALILFDLGGVVVQQSGVETLHEWMQYRFTTPEIWHYWTHSREIHAFECGKLSATEFASAVIRDLKLPVSEDVFLREFASWPVGLFEGAHRDILSMNSFVKTACYTNTNELHWPRLVGEFGVNELFSHVYASHETGITKPSQQAFHLVLRDTGLQPEDVVFVDDNLVNIQSARDTGLHALHVQGWDEAKRALSSVLPAFF